MHNRQEYLNSFFTDKGHSPKHLLESKEIINLEQQLKQFHNHFESKTNEALIAFEKIQCIYLQKLQNSSKGLEMLKNCLEIMGSAEAPIKITFLYLTAHELSIQLHHYNKSHRQKQSSEIAGLLKEAFLMNLNLKNPKEIGYRCGLLFSHFSSTLQEAEPVLCQLILELQKLLQFNQNNNQKLSKKHSKDKFKFESINNIYGGPLLKNNKLIYPKPHNKFESFSKTQRYELCLLLFEVYLRIIELYAANKSISKMQYFENCILDFKSFLISIYPGTHIATKLTLIETNKQTIFQTFIMTFKVPLRKNETESKFKAYSHSAAISPNKTLSKQIKSPSKKKHLKQSSEHFKKDKNLQVKQSNQIKRNSLSSAPRFRILSKKHAEKGSEQKQNRKLVKNTSRQFGSHQEEVDLKCFYRTSLLKNQDCNIKNYEEKLQNELMSTSSSKINIVKNNNEHVLTAVENNQENFHSSDFKKMTQIRKKKLKISFNWSEKIQREFSSINISNSLQSAQKRIEINLPPSPAILQKEKTEEDAKADRQIIVRKPKQLSFKDQIEIIVENEQKETNLFLDKMIIENQRRIDRHNKLIIQQESSQSGSDVDVHVDMDLDEQLNGPSYSNSNISEDQLQQTLQITEPTTQQQISARILKIENEDKELKTLDSGEKILIKQQKNDFLQMEPTENLASNSDENLPGSFVQKIIEQELELLYKSLLEKIKIEEDNKSIHLIRILEDDENDHDQSSSISNMNSFMKDIVNFEQDQHEQPDKTISHQEQINYFQSNNSIKVSTIQEISKDQLVRFEPTESTSEFDFENRDKSHSEGYFLSTRKPETLLQILDSEQDEIEEIGCNKQVEGDKFGQVEVNRLSIGETELRNLQRKSLSIAISYNEEFDCVNEYYEKISHWLSPQIEISKGQITISISYQQPKQSNPTSANPSKEKFYHSQIYTLPSQFTVATISRGIEDKIMNHFNKYSQQDYPLMTMTHWKQIIQGMKLLNIEPRQIQLVVLKIVQAKSSSHDEQTVDVKFIHYIEKNLVLAELFDLSELRYNEIPIEVNEGIASITEKLKRNQGHISLALPDPKTKALSLKLFDLWIFQNQVQIKLTDKHLKIHLKFKVYEKIIKDSEGKLLYYYFIQNRQDSNMQLKFGGVEESSKLKVSKNLHQIIGYDLIIKEKRVTFQNQNILEFLQLL